MSEYEVVIGLEVHSQLLTRSKMFCGCSAAYASEPPNTVVCPVCLGLPGALPAINRQAIELAMMTGLALNCSVAEWTRFDRKNYFYPDLMKNYQISQLDLPVCQNGWLETNGLPCGRIGIRRVHLEEDTARLLHRMESDGRHYSLIDVNRSGVPLMEIVSEPDIRSAEEARLYLVKLRSILQYLGVSTGSMEEGSFRCDANVSVRLTGSKEYGTKVEIKNMNSFRAVYRALQYEVERQTGALCSGEGIIQETRGWNESLGVTVSQRSKEYAHDYRYFPEPDLPPLILSREWVDELRSHLPELPEVRRDRFLSEYGLNEQDTELLTGSKATADFFESVLRHYPQPRLVANWITGELFRLMNITNSELAEARLSPEALVELLTLVDDGALNLGTAKDVLEETFRTGRSAQEIIAERGLTQISDETTLGPVIDEVLRANPTGVGDYLSGRTQARGYLVGQVMRATRGKANPALVDRLLTERLDRMANP